MCPLHATIKMPKIVPPSPINLPPSAYLFVLNGNEYQVKHPKLHNLRQFCLNVHSYKVFLCVKFVHKRGVLHENFTH